MNKVDDCSPRILKQSLSRSELKVEELEVNYLVINIYKSINDLISKKENISDINLLKKIDKLIEYGNDLQRVEKEGEDILDLYDSFVIEHDEIIRKISELSMKTLVPNNAKKSSSLDKLKRKFF